MSKQNEILATIEEFQRSQRPNFQVPWNLTYVRIFTGDSVELMELISILRMNTNRFRTRLLMNLTQ